MMTTRYPLIRSKVRVPRRSPGLLSRARLLDFMHSEIHRKLVLIAAGPGYGKTSLLVDFSHDTDLPVCWLSLDGHDVRVPTFVDYLVAAIRERFPGFGQETLQLLETFEGPEEDVEPFIRLLLHELSEEIDDYFVLVLDDYHTIAQGTAVNALLDGLLLYLPDHCHMVLATREVPRQLTLSRLAAQRQVAGRGDRDLAFTAPEIQELLRNMGVADLSDAQAKRLQERSEGWVTSLILAAQAGYASADEALRLSAASGGVFDYLAHEVLARQRPELQDFLLWTSVLREMSPPLCDSLLGIATSAQLLRELSERNLFTVAMDAEGNWYRYHQLFCEFLRAKLEREDYQTLRSLEGRAAELLAGQGHWRQAIAGFLNTRAHREAAAGIELLAEEAFDGGDWTSLRAWIEALPEVVLDEHPRLLTYLGKLCGEQGELGQAMAYLGRSARGFDRLGDDVGALRARAQQAAVLRMRGQCDQAIELCEKVLRGTGGDDLATIHALRNMGICHNLLGDADRGTRELTRALELAERSADDTNAGHIAHDLGVAELNRGHLVAARRNLHRALMYWRKVGNASCLALSLQALGIIHHHQGEYTESDNRFQESLERALDAGDQRVAAYTVVSQADLYRDMGRLSDAAATYERGLTMATSCGADHLAVYAIASHGMTHRAMGERARAANLLKEAMDGVRQTMVLERGLCHLFLGTLAIDDGAFVEARTHLDAAATVLAKADAKRELGITHLQLARLDTTTGDGDVSAHLGAALETAAEIGTWQFIVAEARPVGDDRTILDLILDAQDLGYGEVDTGHPMRKVLALLPDDGAASGRAPRIVSEQNTPAVALECLALDGAQVLKEGAPVQEWESTVARLMLFLFLSHPRGLRLERVVDILWPDLGPAKGSSQFHSTLYRVRRALYKDVIVHESGLYRIMPVRAYRYDVDEFLRLARLGLGQVHSSSAETAPLARERAIAMYHRPFLEGCPQEWCVEIRRSLEERLVELSHVQAAYLMREGDLEGAERHYARVLQVDPFDERAHRGIMWGRHARGDRAGAIRQYTLCKDALLDEMGISPDEATAGLYLGILDGVSNLPPPN